MASVLGRVGGVDLDVDSEVILIEGGFVGVSHYVL